MDFPTYLFILTALAFLIKPGNPRGTLTCKYHNIKIMHRKSIVHLLCKHRIARIYE